ncbi:MAG: hypothetical protein ACI82F_003528 [Planctomycetota bacterium]|jgi:hypothetical protein
MKLQGYLLSSAALCLTIFASGSGLLASAGSADIVEVGDDVAYSFRTSPVNGAGLSDLSALRGKPILVEFWGTR